MYRGLNIAAVIPALNEAEAISDVVSELMSITNSDDSSVFDRIMVCDNGSTDLTAEIARQAGADVVHEPRAGYGRACLRAIDAIGECDVLVFVDGDRSLFAIQSLRLLDAIAEGNDLVIGSRTQGNLQPGALTLPQRFGNRLAVFLIRCIWGHRYTDLGPFRAIRMEAYRYLHMQDETYGWTVEMQVKALTAGLKIQERPVDSRVRIGQSKISGTVSGVIGAGVGIIGMIWRLWRAEKRKPLADRAAVQHGL
jgi:glycosyltransferase involved in cell wall biosynthesis